MASRFVLYLNVGDLPKTKSDECVKNASELLRSPNQKGVKFIKDDEALFVIAVRDRDTELVEFQG